MPVDPKELQEAEYWVISTRFASNYESKMAGVLIQALREAEAENAKLKQVSAEVCPECGWAMKFPLEGCVNCGFFRVSKELAKAREDIARMREALRDAVSILEHGEIPLEPKPGHIHGPDANCDGDCVDWVRFCDMLGKIKSALSPDPSWLARHDAEKDAEIVVLKRSIGSGGIVAMEMLDRIRELEALK